MNSLHLLFSPRFLGFRNQVFRPGAEGRRRTLIMAGLGLLFCCAMFVVACRILYYFQSVEVIGHMLSRLLLSMVLLTFFSLLIFSHIVAALSNLFLSKDLEFCYSLPVLPEEIFITRFFHTFLDSSWMLIIFGLPIFLAYGFVYGAGVPFYFALIHLNLAMALIASGIGVLITMVLVYVFPAQRTKDVIMLLSVVTVVGLYLMFRFLRPERLVNPDAFFSVTQYLSALKAPQSPYLPTQWISETLWESLRPSGKGCMFEILLSWFTAASLFVINVWVAHFVYFEGFSKSQETRKRDPVKGRFLELFVRLSTFPLKGDLKALSAKDIRTFFRDNSQWSQLLLLLALVVVYLYNFSVLPLDKSPIQVDFLQNEIAFLNMGLAGFVLSAVSARFIFTAVSSEGEAYWIIRTSPMTVSRYLFGKLIFFLFPILFLAESLIVATNLLLDVSGFMMVLSIVTMFFLALGIIAMGVGFGALYPNFKYQNIAQVSTGFGGVLYMIVSALFIAAVIIFEAWPVYVIFMSELRGTPISPAQWVKIVCLLILVFIIMILAIVLPLRAGKKALTNYEG